MGTEASPEKLREDGEGWNLITRIRNNKHASVGLSERRWVFSVVLMVGISVQFLSEKESKYGGQGDTTSAI